MKDIIPHNNWAKKTGIALLTPFRLAGNIFFCGFVVVAAFVMLLLCTLLATFEHFVVEPWKIHHPVR